MSASGYISFKILASSNKTFFTINFSTDLGKCFSNFSVVIQYDAFVVEAWVLYLIESKKVKSNFFDLLKVLTFWIIFLLLEFELDKRLLMLKGFFFLKKKYCLH